MTLNSDQPLPCNYSGGPPIEKWQKEIDFYLNGIMTSVVIALGLVGNTLAVIVLTRRTMHTSTNCFLTALAIWDSVVLLITLVLICLSELSSQFFSEALPYVIVYLYPVGLVAQTATVWLTVSFTVERYIAVCHPLKAASMCTIQRARIVIVVISIVSVLYNVPRWFEYTLLQQENPITMVRCLSVDKTELGRNSIYNKIYFGWLYFLVMCSIPLCSLAVLNTFLVMAVKHSHRQRKDMNVRQSRENNVTIMLVSVVMVFILCQVPALIYNMAYAISMETVTASQGWNVLSTFRNFLVNLNSAVNFILYCALGQKFRRTFVRTFCPAIAKRAHDGFHSFTYTNHMDGYGHSGSHKQNGAVYMKMTPRITTPGAGESPANVEGNGTGNGSGGCKVTLVTTGNGKSCKTDPQKVADQDSGVVVRRYSPRDSVDSINNCDGMNDKHATGKNKIKLRGSERSLLPKSARDREDV
ncbi:hypothetical protein C0Q70_20523 [Pomacea canaliculata]|uniref:G-protein coupled receptors family 1 profile domain-containing protein n=2 Tax=Pomacea canaliculata TaxID=400727 RepID=A0A2T7NFS8_POMCA|nr:hypothetical protein C0Q70_20523 [Pomacea canaliculata]